MLRDCEWNQIHLLVAEIGRSIDMIRRPCHICMYQPRRQQSIILSLSGQTAIAHTACCVRRVDYLWIRHPRVVHAINMLECPRHFSLLPCKPLRPPAWPMREKSAMTYSSQGSVLIDRRVSTYNFISVHVHEVSTGAWLALCGLLCVLATDPSWRFNGHSSCL